MAAPVLDDGHSPLPASRAGATAGLPTRDEIVILDPEPTRSPRPKYVVGAPCRRRKRQLVAARWARRNAPKRRLALGEGCTGWEEARRYFPYPCQRLGAASGRKRDDGRRENVIARCIQLSPLPVGRPPGRSESVCRGSVGVAEVTDSLHLSQEEKLIDLAERPGRLTHGNAGEVGRQVGCLIRSHALQEERPVRCPGGLHLDRRRAGSRGSRFDGRARHGRGGRREDRPGGCAARRSPLSPSTSTSLACHESPCCPDVLSHGQLPDF